MDQKIVSVWVSRVWNPQVASLALGLSLLLLLRVQSAHAEDLLTTVNAEIAILENDKQSMDESLEYLKDLIKSLENGELVMYPTSPATQAAISKKAFSGIIAAQYYTGQITERDAIKVGKLIGALNAKWIGAMQQTLAELEKGQAKAKDRLSYLYNERIRLKAIQGPQPGEHWAGEWVGDGITTMTLKGEGEALSCVGEMLRGPGDFSKYSISAFKRTGPHTLVGTDKHIYEDDEKAMDFVVTCELTIDGDKISVKRTIAQDGTVNKWKIPQYPLNPWTKKGQTWTGVWTRKK